MASTSPTPPHYTTLVATHRDDDAPPASDARDQYTNEATQRYDAIGADIEQAFTALGIDSQTDTPSHVASALAAWLVARQLQADVRPDGRASLAAWVDASVEQAYRDGIQDARDMLRDVGVALDRSTVDARLNQPRHQRALSRLHTAQRDAWRNLAADLEADVRVAIRQAAARGATPAELARVAEQRIDAVGETRAALIGETEPAKAYHRATIEEYKLVGVTEVEVRWETMGDHRVCARCRSGSAASPYTLEAAEGLLPHHPRCRCWLEPVADSLSGPRR